MKTIIAGQEVEITDGGNFKIHINSIFKSAGIIYKFPNRCSGISVNHFIIEKAINEDRQIIIRIGESPRLYTISPNKVMDIVNKYNSIYEKGDLKLCVVPLKELKPV